MTTSRQPAADPKMRPRPTRLALAGALLATSALIGWLAWREVSVRRLADDARRLAAEGRGPEALAAIARWRSARPGSAEAAFLEGRMLLAAGRFDEGFRALDRAAELGHPIEAVERARAVALSKLGRHDQAEPVLRRLLAASAEPDPEAVQALARSQLETFQLHAAAETIDRWIREAPDDPRPHLWRAQVGLRTEAEVEVLERDYREALRLDPSSDEARLGLAELALRAHRFEEAKGLAEAVLVRKLDDAEAHRALGRALDGLGDEAGASEHLDRAASLAPDDVRPLLERARVELRRGRLADALAVLDRAAGVDPAEPEVRYSRALVLARLGRDADAAAERERAAQLRADHDAMNDLLAKLRSRPDDPQLQYESARWLIEHGHPEEGLRWAAKLLRARPGHPEMNRLLADYYEGAGNPGLANFHRLQAGGRR